MRSRALTGIAVLKDFFIHENKQILYILYSTCYNITNLNQTNDNTLKGK